MPLRILTLSERLMKVIPALYDSNYVWWFNSHWLPIDLLGTNLSGSGSLDPSASKVNLETGTTINSYAGVYKSVLGGHGWPSVTWSKPRRFKALVRFYSYGKDSPTHVVTGELTNTEANIEPHVGFKMKKDQCLYATVGDDSAETELEIGGPYSASFYAVLEAVFTPGMEARFYLDGVDKGAIETNLPTGVVGAGFLFNAIIVNEIADDKSLHLLNVKMIQEPIAQES